MAATIVSATILGTALPSFVAHADSSTLYVNNYSLSRCSDSGSGTRDQPYCTVQAAADAAQPGQTVLLADDTIYREQVTVTHSGAPGRPITFMLDPDGTYHWAAVGATVNDANAKSLPHAFVLSGVHDITVKGLTFATPQEAVLVSDSARITVDGNTMRGAGWAISPQGAQLFPDPAPAIRVTGTSSAVTVSRNKIAQSGTAGVAVEAGVSGAVVTTNMITESRSDAVVVTDAPGTAVTSNSIGENCHSAVVLAGNSANSTVENNVVADGGRSSCPSQPDFGVSADSVTGAKLDYNIVPPAVSGGTNYAWGSGTYPTPAAFAAATGQGGHDLADTEAPDAASGAAVDSADALAPGELATDIDGNPRADDPRVANTGTGVGYYDRGAHELQDGLTSGVSAYAVAGVGNPMGSTVDVKVTQGWAAASGTVDFGDGSPKAAVAASDQTQFIPHTYPGPGTYTITLTVADGTLTQTHTAGVTIAPAGPITPSFRWTQPDPSNPEALTFQVQGGSPWPVVTDLFDFGDGSPKQDVGTLPNPQVTHTFPGLGPYTVTQTVTDDHGRSATVTNTVQVGSVVLPLPRVIEAIEGGVLTEIYNDASWHRATIGNAPIHADALAFRYSSSGARVIEAVENGALHEVYSATDGWHDGAITGAGANTTALDFSYSPSGQRVIEAIEGGVLHEIYSDTDGWHDNPIDGVAPDVSALSFSYNSAGQRVIEAIEGGVLHEVYSDTDGWHDNPIDGVAPNVSALSFVYDNAGQRVIEAVEGGVLHEVYSDTDGWHDAAVPGAGSNISSLSVKLQEGGDRLIEAVENNQLHEVYSSGGKWGDSTVPISAANITAASLFIYNIPHA